MPDRTRTAPNPNELPELVCIRKGVNVAAHENEIGTRAGSSQVGGSRNTGEVERVKVATTEASSHCRSGQQKTGLAGSLARPP